MASNETDQSPADAPHYHGHRERLRDRFLNAGAAALSDYELLEMVLFRASPGGHEAAGQILIKKFGSFAEVMHAPEPRLARSERRGRGHHHRAQIDSGGSTTIAKGELKQRTALSSWNDVIDYCRTSMAFADKEQFRILFLDKRNQLIADEVQQTGTVDHTPVYPREVIKRALEFRRPPSSWCTTIRQAIRRRRSADIQMTKAIIDIAGPLGISVHDHIIVGKNGHASMKGLKLI